MTGRLATRRFAADSRSLVDMRRFVANEVERHTSPAVVHDLQLAVTEACANSILHSRTEEIRISVAPVGSCVEITIEDDGVYRRALPVPEAGGTGHRACI